MDDQYEKRLKELSQNVLKRWGPSALPDEEDCWRTEMQAAGVPEPLQDLMCDLLKELHGALGAELWSDPMEEAALLSKRLAHYQVRLNVWRRLTALGREVVAC